MSYTFTADVGDGVKTVFPFSFAGQDTGYLRVTDITVYVAGVSVPFTINPTDPNKAYLTTAPAIGAEVLIRRIMPKNVPYSDFARGNPFSQDTLNNTNLQQLYVVQELLDGFLPEGFYFKQDVNMGGHKLVNLGEGTQSGDSVNWDQWENHEGRLDALEGDLTGLSSRTLPFAYVSVGGETRWEPSGPAFDSAALYINGVFQNQILGAFSITNSGFDFAEPLVAGDEVYALLGSTLAAPSEAVLFSDLGESTFAGLINTQSNKSVEFELSQNRVFDTTADIATAYWLTSGVTFTTKSYSGASGGLSYLVVTGTADGKVTHQIGSTSLMATPILPNRVITTAQIGMSNSASGSSNSDCIEAFFNYATFIGGNITLLIVDKYEISRSINIPPTTNITIKADQKFAIPDSVTNLANSVGFGFVMKGATAGSNAINLPDGANGLHLEGFFLLSDLTGITLQQVGYGIYGGAASNRKFYCKDMFIKNFSKFIELRNTYGATLERVTGRVAGSGGIELYECNAITAYYPNLAYVGESAIQNVDNSPADSDVGYGFVISGGNNNHIITGNIWNCGTHKRPNGTVLTYPNGGGGCLIKNKANMCSVSFYFEVAGSNPVSPVALNIKKGCTGITYNGGLSFPNVIIDNGANTNKSGMGTGYFNYIQPKKLLRNIPNCSFDVDSFAKGWVTVPASTTQAIENDGYSGLKSAAITCQAPIGEFYTNDSAPYVTQIVVEQGQDIVVGFAIKAERALGVFGPNREYAQVSMGISDFDNVEPNSWRAIPVTTKWTWHSFTLSNDSITTSSQKVRLRFTFSGLESPVKVNITDVVFLAGDKIITT